jgi:glycosyltransferase involved in cell wall biosynthesis
MTARNSPLRILELRSVRGTGGGPEKTILLGTARTNSRDYAITVSYIRDERDRIFHVDRRAKDLSLDYIELRERHSFDPTVWRQLVRLVREQQIEIVHAHDYKTDLLAWLLSRRLSTVVPLATSHGWTGHTARERLLYYPADRRILSWFPHVIAVSSEIRDTLIGSGASPDNVSVILNGIDPVAFRRHEAARNDVRRRFGLSPSDFVIGAVGRLEPQKDFAGLIDVFASVTM